MCIENVEALGIKIIELSIKLYKILYKMHWEPSKFVSQRKRVLPAVISQKIEF